MHWNVETKKNIQLVLETLFVVFKNVLPCKFKYIPNHVQKHLIIKRRKTEMMIRYCKVFTIFFFNKTISRMTIFYYIIEKMFK